MLWLCLRFPLLPLEVFPNQTPVQPALVSERRRVLLCNAPAAACGIAPGVALTTAQALCPDAEVIERCRGREQGALLALAYWCYRFTPAVSLCTSSESPPADSLMLEIGGCLQLFKGLPHFLALIDQGLREQAYSHARGLAPTPSAAYLLSHQGSDCADLFAAQSGQPHDLAAYRRLLHAVPLPHLDCPAGLKEKFALTGFRHLGDLLRLPMPALGRRYGEAFLTYLQQVTGQLPDPRQPIQLPPQFASELVFTAEILSAEMLLFPMKRLLMALCGYLQRRQFHCGRLQWHLGLANGGRATIELGFARPQNQLTHFLSLSRLRLGNLNLTAPVERLALTVEDLHPARHQEVDLFGECAGSADDSAFDELLDRLSTRLGADAVSGLALADNHIPEQAWQAIASGEILQQSPPPRERGVRASKRAGAGLRVREGTPLCPAAQTPTAASELAATRPLWLFPEPIPIRMRDRQLHWRGALALLRGPERIDSGWWQNAQPLPSFKAGPLQPPVQRDYFVARHQDGPLYWIYRDRRTRRWFVHGAFG